MRVEDRFQPGELARLVGELGLGSWVGKDFSVGKGPGVGKQRVPMRSSSEFCSAGGKGTGGNGEK